MEDKEKQKTRSKEYYEKNKSKISKQAKLYYEKNKEKLKEYAKEYCEKNKDKIKEYYKKNKDKFAERYKEWYEKNKDKISKNTREYYERNKDKIKEYREKNKDRYKKLRDNNKDKLNKYSKEYYEKNKVINNRLKAQVIDKYSNGENKCACCGLTDVRNLTIDHINGNGKKHREETGGGGIYLYKWLIDNNFPEGFQVLCFGCNLEKARGVRVRKKGGMSKLYILDRAETRSRRAVRRYYLMKNRKIRKKYNRKLKEMVIERYSHGTNKCAMCGLAAMNNLTIDHVNGGGTEHRKEIGCELYKWLIDNNFPDGYQVLCFACNLKKGTSTSCSTQPIMISLDNS